jgi:hypothetical protein
MRYETSREESGEWRVESGEWRVENGGWRVESGEWRRGGGLYRGERTEQDAERPFIYDE